MNNYKYYIGIDPGVNTGICVWAAASKEIMLIKSAPIHLAMEVVKTWKEFPGDIFVRFEDARQRKWIPRQKNERAEKGLWAGAGSVKRDCTIWEDYLTSIGVPFEMVPPKNNKTKVTADYFKKLTGWTGKTNEHARDAAMLVIGK